MNYQTSKMGEHLKTLRNQLPQTLFLGLAIGSSVEMKEFMRAGRSGTFAGIKTDANARVMDKRNQPIAGLYAVGNDQASVFAGAYPGPGSTLGPAMTFGYIAGRHAAGVHAPETSSAQAKNVAPAAALV